MKNKMESKIPENVVYIHNYDGTINRKEIFNAEQKSSTMYLGKTLAFPVGTKLVSAPSKIDLVSNYYIVNVAIGEDHSAMLLIDEKSLIALRDIQPEPTII